MNFSRIRLGLAVSLFGMAAAIGPGLRAQPSDNATDIAPLPPAPAETATPAEPPALSDKTSAAFSKLKPLLDAKQWDQALAVIDDAEKSADPNSYDMAVLLDTKAKLLLEGKNDYAAAIAPWEQALQMYREHPNYYKRSDVLEMLLGLAQMNYEVAAGIKTKAQEPEQQRRFSRAIGYMRLWIGEARRPTVDQIQFYATLLYYKAMANAEHPDRALLDQAAKEARLGLLLSVQPHASFYQLLIAIDQQEGNLRQSAEYLQLLLSLPGESSQKRSYYPELVAIYANLAGAADRDPRAQRVYYADAIDSLERAQRLGLMKTPKDNYNLVSMYYAVGQYARAIDLLHAGLRNGSIDSTLANWQALSYFYQEEDENFEAIAALKEAERRFPRIGSIDFTIAQLYEQLDRSEDAYTYVARAIRKGGLQSHLFVAYQLYAWLAYQMRHYGTALHAIDEAEKLKAPRGEKAEMSRMREAVVQAKKLQDAANDAARAARQAEEEQRRARLDRPPSA